MKILTETFREEMAPASEVGERLASYINGKIDVEFKGKIVTVWAKKYDDGPLAGQINVLGFVGRYLTGQKLWRANVSIHPVRGQVLAVDPAVDRVACNAQMLGNLVHRHPRFSSHRSAPAAGVRVA